MAKRQNLINQRFGRLVVVGRTDPQPEGRYLFYDCVCDCGNFVSRMTSNITRNPDTGSCGCYGKERWVQTLTTHGLSKHPMYMVWKGMRERCCTPSNYAFRAYGAKGIRVDPVWANDFKQFYDDMLPTWFPGATLDRRKNHLGYSKGNCRWATVLEQGRNKTNNITGIINGNSYCLSEAVEKFGQVEYGTAWMRIKNGWLFDKAVTTPKRGRAV